MCDGKIPKTAISLISYVITLTEIVVCYTVAIVNFAQNSISNKVAGLLVATSYIFHEVMSWDTLGQPQVPVLLYKSTVPMFCGETLEWVIYTVSRQWCCLGDGLLNSYI